MVDLVIVNFGLWCSISHTHTKPRLRLKKVGTWRIKVNAQTELTYCFTDGAHAVVQDNKDNLKNSSQLASTE